MVATRVVLSKEQSWPRVYSLRKERFFCMTGISSFSGQVREWTLHPGSFLACTLRDRIAYTNSWLSGVPEARTWMGTVLTPGRSERKLDRAESAKAPTHLSSPYGNCETSQSEQRVGNERNGIGYK